MQPKKLQLHDEGLMSVIEGGEAEAGAGAEAVPPPPRAEDACRHLTEAELRVVVGMLPASLGGSILGSALCWQQVLGWVRVGVSAGVSTGVRARFSYPSPLP